MLIKITIVEFRMRMREMLTPAFALALPLAMLFGFGLLPHAGRPNADLGGQSLAEYIAVLGMGVAFVILAVVMLPSVLSDYREKGVLRRMRATPVRPSALLAAQLAVNLGAAAVSAATMVVVGRLALGTALPRAFGWFLAAVALSLLALFAVGLLIAALAPSGRAGNAIGMVLFFPSMFFAGYYVPRSQLPEAVARIGDYTPLGAGVKTIGDAWTGHAPEASQLAVLGLYAVVAGAVAARTFRWE
ncbi:MULTISPECIES: ABC transporter permease [Actinomadura]|uniref:Transport permease protein n=1 Tax=Actinomadura yumaensis TaxID=111807 RepID=A0ABW2CZI5_9ACTN|nr:ABC transporter permease [Actinomadura sp. J1-007]MWK32669.1 ABC transporter permease [Actinomadura sp. J1-007]